MSLPDPLVPAATDIAGLDSFMLNVQVILGSELLALSTGDEFKAAVTLWCRAWTQSPPGSLPNDERVLAAFSGAGAKWKKVRAMALRGFVQCSDGRLYHKTLCEDVMRAAERKKERHERTVRATAARQAKRDEAREIERHEQRDVGHDDERHVDVTDSHRRDGTGRDAKKEPNDQQPHPEPAAAADVRNGENYSGPNPEEIERRCIQATDWHDTKGISAIVDLIRAGGDFDGRILPMLRTMAKDSRQIGKPPPKFWAYAVKVCNDPTRQPDIAEQPVAQVWVAVGSPKWLELIAGGKKESFLRMMVKRAEDGSEGVYANPAWFAGKVAA